MTMKRGIVLVALALAAAGGQAVAQTANDPLNAPVPGSLQTIDPGQPAYDPSAPDSMTGQIQPPPGLPPEGQAAEIKLPDCTPPNCGVPDIMGPPK
ncbi:ABC-type transport system substrate-binding protein [Ancylobacter sp. 3268]|uniref:hypothetical protein n=1 Tax=Ancylobacter sp. 3268 TaxID=2817752 RepID=UPI00286473F1|nr:hypothetical protein [Ancylobacter sp. 3268]MDR6954830.1 ABC-type transport system substrate-binding protein [Ancylobacter sp. 3268]